MHGATYGDGVCPDCGDDRGTSGGSAAKAHARGTHHTANLTLTRRARDGWCPLTLDLFLDVMEATAARAEVEEDGRWSDEDDRGLCVFQPQRFVRAEALRELLDCPPDPVLYAALHGAGAAWSLAAQEHAAASLLPWWVCVRAAQRTRPAALMRNRPVGSIRGRAFPKSLKPEVGLQQALSLAAEVRRG
jgi:hypothetical protein